jgi:hypothetical protein
MECAREEEVKWKMGIPANETYPTNVVHLYVAKYLLLQ